MYHTNKERRAMNIFTLRRVDKDSHAFLDTKSIPHIVYNQVNLWGFCVTARRRKEETPTIQKPHYLNTSI